MKQYMIILSEDMKTRLSLVLGGGLEFIEVVGMSSVQGGQSFDILMTPSNHPVPVVCDPNTITHDIANHPTKAE